MPNTRIDRLAAALCAAAVCCAGPAFAQPFFSVANGGPSGLEGDLIFENNAGNPVPIGGGQGMGLGRVGDDIIGLAPVIVDTLRGTGRATSDFIICFSVDPFAMGVSRFRITQQNLFRQSQNNQQAGDAYLSTEALRRDVGVLPPPFSMGLDNNALAVNQSPHYPNDFALAPLADPGQMLPPGTMLDDIDATLNATLLTPPVVFFTLDADSPSHPFLPGPDSGATVFLDQDIQLPGSESVFATPNDLGLDFFDQIDGLIVFDDNLNGIFDGTDAVYFSLAPGSPTLLALGLRPGDVLAFENGNLSLFAPGLVFGLALDDNMNALDFVPLINGSAEDTINSMVSCPADFNEDTEIDTLDVLAFLNAWVAQDGSADFNGDGSINTLDVLEFLNAWVSGC
ncbi:MAG: GC-type dockerin domain-anchored protein [Planctomycetota bacterium]|nr:GC-type dockerin domain-anchored protein [Planctomycetota bacterium]